MKFTNEVVLDLPADDLFAFLSDIERVAPCMPGARLEGREGDAYRGSMRVKVGAIVADYSGTFVFEELDPATRRAVIVARAEEAGGQGGAEATINASVVEEATGSRTTIETDLQVRGRVAQFGRGPMEKISKRMFAEFARNLEREMQSGDARKPSAPDAEKPPPDASAGAPAGASKERPPGAQPAASIDALELLSDLVPQTVRRSALAFLIGLTGYLLGRLHGRGGR